MERDKVIVCLIILQIFAFEHIMASKLPIGSVDDLPESSIETRQVAQVQTVQQVPAVLPQVPVVPQVVPNQPLVYVLLETTTQDPDSTATTEDPDSTDTTTDSTDTEATTDPGETTTSAGLPSGSSLLDFLPFCKEGPLSPVCDTILETLCTTVQSNPDLQNLLQCNGPASIALDDLLKALPSMDLMALSKGFSGALQQVVQNILNR